MIAYYEVDSMKKVFVLFFIILLFLQCIPAHAQTDLTTSTERFINAYMKNPNFTLATYLVDQKGIDPEIAAGRESLSESIGLELTYLVQKKDRKSFEDYYQLLKKSFISPSTGIVYWKLEANGTANVTTNALIDDWRIADALFNAGEIWGIPEYITTASNICKALNTYNRKNGYLVDFYDEQYKVNNDTISFFYIDPIALHYMSKYKLMDSNTYSRMISLLKNVPMDGGFFAENYNVLTDEVKYASTVNMVEQLYTAYFRELAGFHSSYFYSFIKNEFIQKGVLYGQYDRSTRKPAVNYESNAVYGMLILYALQMDDTKFAKKVYQRMKQFEITDPASPYYGGYVVQTSSGYNTHIFDNLFPLLAKQKLETFGK